MAMRFPQQQHYGIYGNNIWSDDIKQEYAEVEEEDENILSPSPANMTTTHDIGRHSAIKLEDDAGTTQVWHNRPSLHMPQMRHYSQPNVPVISLPNQHIGRMIDHNFSPNFGHSSAWSLSAHSESTTPTPVYPLLSNGLPNGYHHPVQYNNTSFNFSHGQTKDPASAVSMSPQSSHGGWGSATSSDNTDPHSGDGPSPRFRPMSPMTVLRSDGIRKKNARFEIPRDRNLANIDALIMQSTDDAEKKELKQQKRLLRNRQAALDSRQRKKTHTEKLEQEKKVFTTQKAELEDTVTQLENTLNQEREEWTQERQQYQSYIQNLEYARDEAIRTKTLETAELRRMNNALKDCIRDLERQQHARGYSSNSHDGYNSDFSSFDNLGLEDSWEDQFGLMDNEDMRMGGESPRRDVTPRPPTSDEPKPTVSTKHDTPFNSNTLWMYVLLGAQWASNINSKFSNAATASSVNMPALPEEYRAEAGNVLKVVLDSKTESVQELSSSPSASRNANSKGPAVVDTHDFSRGSAQLPASSLDTLHNTLTTPTRRQQLASMFSLSASSYNHVTNPEGLFDDDEPENDNLNKPTQLERAFAAMRASRDDLERMAGLSSKAHEKSVLLDRVPEKALRDFKQLVGMSNTAQRQQSAERNP